MIHPSQQRSNPDGKRKGMRIVIDRRGRMTSVVVKPWLSLSVIGLFILFGLGYLGSTAYLFYRDDVMEAAEHRHQEMEHSYRNQLSFMRDELNRLTSRQIVERQGIKSQVSAILDQQEMIDRRQLILDTLIAKARSEGISVAVATAPLPVPRPVLASDGSSEDPVMAQGEPTAVTPTSPALSYSPAAASDAARITGSVIREQRGDRLVPSSGPETIGPGTKPDENNEIPAILRELRSSLDEAAISQEQALRALARAADSESDRLQSVLAGLNVPAPKAPQTKKRDLFGDFEEAGLGGPYIPAPSNRFIEESLSVERAISHLRLIRDAGREIPVGSPIAGARVSSKFGYRRDPFMGRRAFHSGIDFRAPTGTPVRSTAPGKVIFAGRRGGYGKVVEIRHAHGLTTRYAHLSSIKVRRGKTVSSGQIIGLVGSTGRSTGPHLHYETRNGKTPLNPRRFLAAAGAF